MNNYVTFLYAWGQVSLIATNTYQIANGHWVGALIVGFLISLVWTFNVKRAAFATWTTRIIYCAGHQPGQGRDFGWQICFTEKNESRNFQTGGNPVGRLPLEKPIEDHVGRGW